MTTLEELMSRQPVVPFIRNSEFAVRTPWHMPIRRLLDYLLIYVQEGNFLVHVDGVQYTFESGQFCLIQPNSVLILQGTTNTITPYAHLDIFYNPLREQSFPTGAGQLDLSAYQSLLQPRLNDLHGIFVPIRFVPEHPVQFRDTLLRMIQCWQSRDAIEQLEAQTLATELILSILKKYASVEQPATSTTQSLNWITSFLSFHLTESLSVKDMAKRANLSPSRFSAVFRETFGMPPHQYLLKLRLQHSEELLRTTEFTLQDIAVYCGFADVHHFSKAFKRTRGVWPGAYRESARARESTQ
jgi:AraC-like DNA-binding protein